jgi:hypothetical protein
VFRHISKIKPTVHRFSAIEIVYFAMDAAEELFSYQKLMGHEQANAQKTEVRLSHYIKAHMTRSQKLGKTYAVNFFANLCKITGNMFDKIWHIHSVLETCR